MFKNRKHTPETIEKMRLARLGKKRVPFSEEWKANIGKAHIGKNTWSKGRKLTEEHKKKISDAIKGEKHPLYGKSPSAETRAKSSKSHMGQKGWNKGKTGIYSEETLKRMSESSRGKTGYWKGKIMAEEVKQKIRDKKNGNQIGQLNPNWRGGITSLYASIRSSSKMKAWVLDVMRRDHFTCQECGNDKGGNLEVDHITPFSYLLNQLKECEKTDNLLAEAYLFEPLWDLRNGRTLCHDCHKKTPTYGSKALSYKPLPTNT